METPMRTARFTPGDVLKPFSRKQVLTKAELLQACGCSAMTAWRILRQQGYLTSYNHNAKYYTLARIAQFDEQGLWAYRDIRFSKWGTLPETVLGQIELSAAGMTARELEELLHDPERQADAHAFDPPGPFAAREDRRSHGVLRRASPRDISSNSSGGKRRPPRSDWPSPCPIPSTSLPCWSR